MSRWTFPIFALPLVIAALSIGLLRPAAAQAAPAASTAQNYGAIARTALSAANQQHGDCFTWVRSVVQTAVGRNIGGNYHTGYLLAGAIEVPLLGARDGDIIQVTNPAITAANADYPGLHTAIVLDNLGGGKFRIIDSNMNFDGVVRIREQYSPSEVAARYAGLVVRAYRLEGMAGVGPSAAAPALPSPTATANQVVPTPGALATIAADGDCLRVRSSAGLSGSVLGCLPTGARVTVTQSGPTADGYRWVQVAAGSLTGWVAANYLSTSIAATTLTPGPATATVPLTAPPRGVFASTPIFGAGSGQAAAVFMGGAVDQLISAATDARASGVWVQDASGAFHLLIVGGPTFMVDAFRARFPAPFAAPIAVTLIGTAA